MKTLVTLLAVLSLSVGVASAQDVTGFKAPQSPGFTTQSSKNPPSLHPDLSPKVGGVFVDGVKYGTIMISPTAPAEYGMGEKYLAAPSTRTDLKHESGYAAHRDTGGLKLLTYEF